jgi:hypothetical protein
LHGACNRPSALSGTEKIAFCGIAMAILFVGKRIYCPEKFGMGCHKIFWMKPDSRARLLFFAPWRNRFWPEWLDRYKLNNPL